jgi:hypothetical protein
VAQKQTNLSTIATLRPICAAPGKDLPATEFVVLPFFQPRAARRTNVSGDI